jgi:GNAT superfamily N-acetyltransferase
MPAEFKGYILQQERIEDMHAEIKVLHARHYHETETKYLDRPMDADYAGFAELERQGAFVCYTAREFATGQMVGYLMYFVSRSLHMAAKVAQEDAYYVAPEHRGTGLARQLLRNAEKDLRESHGVDFAFMSSKKPVGGPNIGPLLEIEGYSEVAHVYCKKLER